MIIMNNEQLNYIHFYMISNVHLFWYYICLNDRVMIKINIIIKWRSIMFSLNNYILGSFYARNLLSLINNLLMFFNLMFKILIPLTFKLILKGLKISRSRAMEIKLQLFLRLCSPDHPFRPWLHRWIFTKDGNWKQCSDF